MSWAPRDLFSWGARAHTKIVTRPVLQKESLMARTRRALLTSAVAAGSLVAAACGAGDGGQTANATKQPVRLTFEWPTYTPPKQEWAEYAMKTYSQKFPHV